MKMSMEKEFWI